MTDKKIYAAIIERIFESRFTPGMCELEFHRQDIVTAANELNISLPKNIGDLIYSFRYRAALPSSIQSQTTEGTIWIIRPAGRSRYRFVLIPDRPIVPNENMVATKIPDATPGIVAKYAFNDEQALLAKLRYNRLIDIFTGVTCYSLQNHLRTTVPTMGQVETDEIYVGVDKRGAHYIFPIQAKGRNDRLNIVQIEQDMAVCAQKVPSLICRPLAAQFMQDGIIVLFEFEQDDKGVGIANERHYHLVPPDEITDTDLASYRIRVSN